jgi:transcriptional regulator with XRE-family HTH domain
MNIYDVLASMKKAAARKWSQLGEAIRKRRAAFGLSQEEFAERIDCHRNFIGRLERGEQNPTVDTLVRLAKGLRCKVVDIIKDSGL